MDVIVTITDYLQSNSGNRDKKTYVLHEVFYLMPFPRKIHRQTPLKMIEPRKTALLTVKKTTTTKTERISWQHE